MRRQVDKTERGLAQSDLGRDDPPPVAPSRGPKAWEARQLEAQKNQTAFLNLLEQVTVHLGGVADFLKAPPAGDVLNQNQTIIGSSGVFSRRFPSPFAAVAVSNLSSAVVTVTSGAPMSQAPVKGAGVATVAGGMWRTLPMRGTELTIYGPPGSAIEFAVYSRPREPAAGAVTQGPGEGVLLPAGQSASAVASLTQATFRSLVVVTNVSAIAGGTVQVTINGLTPSGYVYPLLLGPAYTALGVAPLRIGPDMTPSLNAVANDCVPKELQVVATVTGSITYGIDFVVGR